ncbi:DUF2019 domain-containing protein [Neobacillus pocheonensis]|uniref:DUF2019 domain-containing protein n=1 Tax=Neobacillus pocheonensis TaxID=363869 RepID=A0ABT0WHH7_9BACI|nr:DUF2019 domain-containing protein [Neobacillus pocheonensis]
MKTLDEFLILYFDTVMKNGEASDSGDAKLSNKLYKKSNQLLQKIKYNYGLDTLIPYLNHQNEYVKMAVAVNVFPIAQDEAKEAVENVYKTSTNKLLSLQAKFILKEMDDSNSRFYK